MQLPADEQSHRVAGVMYAKKAEIGHHTADLGCILFALALLTSLDCAHCSTALLKLGLALVEEDAPELHFLLLAFLIQHLEAGQDLIEVIADPSIHAREVGLPQCLVKHLLSKTDMNAVVHSGLKARQRAAPEKIHEATWP